MRVFLYGTLLDPSVLAARSGRRGLRGVAARLPGWMRVALRGQPYPTLVRARRQAVRGLLLTLAGAPLRRLRVYEGAAYRLLPVLVLGPRGRTAALAWIARQALADAGAPWQASHDRYAKHAK